MTALLIGFVTFTLALGFYLWLCLPKRGRWTGVGLVAFIALLGVVWFGGADVLARPKPTHLEWRQPGQAEIIAAKLQEDVAIYLWLILPDEAEPRSYVLPWDQEQAEQLLKAMREGQERGVMMHKPFRSNRSLENRPTFHPSPQEAPPPRESQEPPKIFRKSL
jgi:hypothetical protein